jgi:pimeloyl-ACP methyl ester carboxylesterase
MPCLLIVGEIDEVYPAAQRCAQQMPNVTFVTLPGLDHGEVIRRSDLVVPHVTSFLATVHQ